MRRCNVLSCPFVAVLLLILGGAACQGTKRPATSCYYKENGVKKSCEIFEEVECENKTSYTVPDCNWSQRDESTDSPAYYNETFWLWASEGYFAMKEVDKCWKFKVGERQYPAECVFVKLDYVPDSNGTDMTVWGDREHCDYLSNSTYVMQIHKETNETFKVSFSFQTPYDHQQLDLTLMGGECEVSCDGRKNKCDVFQWERIMKNVKGTESFTSLRQGYYCMRIDHGNCALHTSTIRAVADNSNVPSPLQEDSSEMLLILACLTIAVVALIVIAAICLKRKSYGVLRQLLDSEEEDPPTQWQSIHQQWAISPVAQTELLLLYSRDCREFCDVMQAFSQLLKNFGNMKVLDPMAQNQMEKVSENIPGWLAQHLRNPDVRVVLVVSEGAKQRQRALLNNQIVRMANPHFLDHVYTQALQQMHEDPNLGSDYTRIFPVRFEDFTPSEESLSLIVPLTCYVLQKHLGKLILELRGFNAPIGLDLEDIRSICPKEVDQLESTIRIMKTYCARNPHYISKHFSLVAPST